MAKINVETPDKLLADLDGHVDGDKKFVNRDGAVRASIRRTPNILGEIDDRHDCLVEDE